MGVDKLAIRAYSNKTSIENEISEMLIVLLETPGLIEELEKLKLSSSISSGERSNPGTN